MAFHKCKLIRLRAVKTVRERQRAMHKLGVWDVRSQSYAGGIERKLFDVIDVTNANSQKIDITVDILAAHLTGGKQNGNKAKNDCGH